MSAAREGLLLTLTDPVIATAEAASAGRPETLDFLPGAMLLGAFAARDYATFETRELAFDVFHSGAVRFGDALPVAPDGRVGYPAPAALHHAKGGKDGSARGAVNFTHARPDDGQYKQLRDMEIATCGEKIEVARVAAMKTAIDPAKGRAMDAQLFGIEALAAGQRFWAEISADDPALLAAVKAAIADGATLRLGRSRAAEYGRATACWTPPPPLPATSDSSPDGPLLLWALSDIALDPEADGLAEALGLDGATIDAARSFLRLRRVWPYNGYWGARGQERLVVRRGSVIAVEKGGPSPGPGFLGLHRAIGCGRTLAAPLALEQETFTAQAPALALGAEWRTAAAEDEADGAAETTFRLLQTRRKAAAGALAREAEAQIALAELGRLYVRAAGLSGEDPGLVGPGPSQWSAVRAAVGAPGGDAALFGADRGIARPGDRDWGAATGPGRSFRDWLRDQHAASTDDPERLALIAKGAAEAVAALRDTGEWRVRL